MTAHTTIDLDADRDLRTGLLARADRTALIELADTCLEGLEVSLITGPQLGTLLMQIREPIERRRFYLGDVLVTEVRLSVGCRQGWAIRLGDDPEATVAAAICDACSEAESPYRAAILELCRATQAQLAANSSADIADIVPTAIAFEELGG